MIRVVYRWKVPEANRAAFRSAWAQTTTAIRAETDGARGSLLLESSDDPTEVMTIAHWDSLDQWKAFIGGAPRGQMKRMHELAELVSSTPFRLVEDHTI